MTITKIGELKEGMMGLYIEGVVTMMSSPREVRGGLKIIDAMLANHTGTIKLALWEDQIQQAREGAKIRVINGYTTSFRGTLQLNPGKFGRIETIS